jgi:hypothetical protein
MSNSWDKFINDDGSFDAHFNEDVDAVREWPDIRLVRVHYASSIQRVITESAFIAVEYEMNRRGITYKTTPVTKTRVSMFIDGKFKRYVSFASEDELKTFT